VRSRRAPIVVDLVIDLRRNADQTRRQARSRDVIPYSSRRRCARTVLRCGRGRRQACTAAIAARNCGAAAGSVPRLRSAVDASRAGVVMGTDSFHRSWPDSRSRRVQRATPSCRACRCSRLSGRKPAEVMRNRAGAAACRSGATRSAPVPFAANAHLCDCRHTNRRRAPALELNLSRCMGAVDCNREPCLRQSATSHSPARRSRRRRCFINHPRPATVYAGE